MTFAHGIYVEAYEKQVIIETKKLIIAQGRRVRLDLQLTNLGSVFTGKSHASWREPVGVSTNSLAHDIAMRFKGMDSSRVVSVDPGWISSMSMRNFPSTTGVLNARRSSICTIHSL